MTTNELAAGLSLEDLRQLTNGMIDTVLELITDATDADVTFVPVDANANDTFVADEADRYISWTLGHVIVHLTASSEESAALGAELARGVEFHGRSRAEVTWQEVTTIAECRQRLEESRRMCLASLDMWPDNPHLDNTYEARPGNVLNPKSRFIGGLSHADSHLAQVEEVARQAKVAREGEPA
jgi:hypothetical protein